MSCRLLEQRIQEPGRAFDTSGQYLAHQLRELSRRRPWYVLEQRKRILYHVGRQLILVHENEVSIRLLTQKYQKVVMGEPDELGRELVAPRCIEQQYHP